MDDFVIFFQQGGEMLFIVEKVRRGSLPDFAFFPGKFEKTRQRHFVIAIRLLVGRNIHVHDGDIVFL